MPDYRDVAAHAEPWYEHFDERTQVASLWLTVGECEEYTEVRCVYDVCPTCNGRGRYVNPSIDSHGLTAEDFAEDPDFARAYRCGTYDITCVTCSGKRVVPVPDKEHNSKEILQAVEEHIRWQRRYALECASERELGF